MLHSVTELILILIFTISGIKDYRDSTLPIRLFVIPYSLIIIDIILQGDYIKFLSGGVIFLLFYLSARYLGSGGGDALLLPILALEYGLLNALLIITNGLLCSLIIAIYRSCRYNQKVTLNMNVPLIPGIAICLCIFQIISIII